MIWLITIWLFGSLLIAAVTAMLGKKYGLIFLAPMFIAGIICSAAVIQKFVNIFGFSISAGLVAFSITFLITDVISEFWGKKAARQVVGAGFMVYLMFVFTTQIALLLEPAIWWEGQEAFELIFGQSWRIGLGSICAYIIGQSHDVWAFHFWKKVTKGRHLWLRNNISTATSQIIDTMVFFVIAFWGSLGIIVLVQNIIVKLIIAAADTPFLYLIRWYYEKVPPYKKGKPVSIEVPVV